MYVTSLQDTHLSQCTESVSCPFKEQLCNTYFPSRVWHVILLLCTTQTLLWRKNGSFPSIQFSLAQECCNSLLCSIIFVEICVCVSESMWQRGGWWPNTHTAGDLLHFVSIFWIPVSSWGTLGRGTSRATFQFNLTHIKLTWVPQKSAGMQTKAWQVGMTGRSSSKPHCSSDLRGCVRHILWEDHLFYRWRNYTHRG